jgi:anthranilate phosphoribosyltransferase
VAQTLMKLLDPLAADARAVGVFHAPYLPSTAAALRDRVGRSLCVQALGGLPEATAGKMVRVCRPGGEPETIDLRPLAPAADATTVDDGSENAAALAGAPVPAVRAAAVAGVLLFAAREVPPLVAAEQALATLRDGRAAAVAARLRDA